MHQWFAFVDKHIMWIDALMCLVFMVDAIVNFAKEPFGQPFYFSLAIAALFGRFLMQSSANEDEDEFERDYLR
jgi:hypothetical protein